MILHRYGPICTRCLLPPDPVNVQPNYKSTATRSVFPPFGQRTRRGRCPIAQRGEFSVRLWGQGLSKGRRGLGERGGGWLEVWNKGAGAWRGPRGWGWGGPSGDQPDGRSDGRSDVRTFGRTDGRTEDSPLCAIGHRPLRVRCPKGFVDRRALKVT